MDRIIIAVVIVGGYLALAFAAASPVHPDDGVTAEVAASVSAHAAERRLGVAQAETASVAAVTADTAERLLTESAVDGLRKPRTPY